MKYCKDCKFFKKKIENHCIRNSVLGLTVEDPVLGFMVSQDPFCSVERAYGNCGKNAIFFEPKKE